MRALWILLPLCVAGCAVQKPVERVPFPIQEYESLPTTGSASVSGQAFLKTRGGDVKLAAGNVIILNPITSYSQQWYEVVYQQGKTLEPYDPRIEKWGRNTKADAEGRFEFKNVPGGNYFVVTLIMWEVPSGNHLTPTGGYVCERIAVHDGDHLNVIVTR